MLLLLQRNRIDTLSLKKNTIKPISINILFASLLKSMQLRFQISSGITKVNREVVIVLLRKAFIVFRIIGEEPRIVGGD